MIPKDFMECVGYGGTLEQAIESALTKRREAGYSDTGRSLEVVFHRVEPWRSYHDMFGENYGYRHVVVLE